MIRLTFSVPASEVLHRIEVFGHEWRESKMPLELRKLGLTGARATVDGHSFVFSLHPADRRNGAFIVRGDVTSEASASVVTAKVEEAKWSKRLGWGWAIVASIILVTITLSDTRISDAGYVLLPITALFLGRVIVVQALRTRAESHFRSLLEHAVLTFDPKAT